MRNRGRLRRGGGGGGGWQGRHATGTLAGDMPFHERVMGQDRRQGGGICHRNDGVHEEDAVCGGMEGRMEGDAGSRARHSHVCAGKLTSAKRILFVPGTCLRAHATV